MGGVSLSSRNVGFSLEVKGQERLDCLPHQPCPPVVLAREQAGTGPAPAQPDALLDNFVWKTDADLEL